MSDILIVVPNYTGSAAASYNYMFPLGIGYVVASLKKSGFNPDILNLNHLDGGSCELLRAQLDRKVYKIVATGGISVIYKEVKAIIRTAAEHPTHPVTILGGPVLTTEPEAIYDAIRPDYGAVGEGEITMQELINCILNGKDCVVAGTVYNEAGKTVIAPQRAQIETLDDICFPDLASLGYEEWLEHVCSNLSYFAGTFDYPRVYPILGNRGCPFKCTFCFHYEKYRERSLDNIFAELTDAVLRYRINVICLNDDCFALKLDRVTEFCRRIGKLRKKIDWDLQWTCQLTVKNISPELLAMLKNAGCNSISYGFESYSPTVLKSMGKPIKPHEIDCARKMTLAAGIIVQGNFIFGDVAETIDTATETLSYWLDKCDGQIALSMIQVYPGSAIYQYCKERGIITDPVNFIEGKITADTSINFSDRLTEKQYRQLDEFVHYARERFMYPTVGKVIGRTADGHYKLKVNCPHCRKKFELNNVHLPNPRRFYFDFRCRYCNNRFILIGLFTWIRMLMRLCYFGFFKWSPLRWKLFRRKRSK